MTNTKLPLFQRVPSQERDITVMRPPPDATDYLIPNNPRSNSNYSMSTEKTELLSPDSCSTVTNENNAKLMEFDEHTPPIVPPRTGTWRETSFSKDDMDMEPKSQNPNEINTNQISAKQPSTDIILDPSALPHPIRYVNVDVNDCSSNPRLNSQQISC